MRRRDERLVVAVSFEILSAPALTEIAPFRFAHARIRGPYHPWSRIQALDAVAEALERLGVQRVGPAFGIYHDMPDGAKDPAEWAADLGYPVVEEATLPPRPGLRLWDVPGIQAVGLRYRGDLTSFPEAFQHLLHWARGQDIPLAGPLLERFHVSNALTGEEDRDVWVGLHPLPR